MDKIELYHKWDEENKENEQRRKESERLTLEITQRALELNSHFYTKVVLPSVIVGIAIGALVLKLVSMALPAA